MSEERDPVPASNEPLDDENPSLVSDFIWFLRENKKWWLIPLVVLVLVLGLIALLAAKASILAPFIYPVL